MLQVQDGDVTIDMASLSTLMNRYVWKGPGAPLSNVKMGTDGALLTQWA
ncbi:MAG: hypothetical protein ABIW19_13405 [Vicinamibacterales bacterium]